MVGICIKYFHENYGGMLQAFATTKILEDRNIEYELIVYKKKVNLITFFKYIPRMFNGVLINDKKEAMKKRVGKKKHPEFAANDEIRLAAFHVFEKNNFIKLSSPSYTFGQLKKSAQKYNAIVTGSDQLWSPAGLPTNFYNLMFVPDNIRKISYASSFGVGQIPWYQKTRTKEFLERFEFISMRENRGSEIVKELTDKKVPVVLDPIFMISTEKWDQLIPVKEMVDKPYIFAYFLGTTPEYRNAIKEFGKAMNCPIVALRHMDQYVEEDETFGDIAPYNVGPEEFLNYLRGAEYVFTDSFHGSAFSIMYEKKFVTFNRYMEGSKNSKNSRIDTLCKNLGLEDRRYNGDLQGLLTKNVDYVSVKAKCAELESLSNKYLDNALNGIV